MSDYTHKLNQVQGDLGSPSLYIHVPFCIRRCLYCDFYVEPLGTGPLPTRLQAFRSLQHDGFLDALDRELAALPDFLPRTIYIGGGTPTEMSVDQLARVFDSIDYHIDRRAVVEFCCEANPGTLDRAMARLLQSRGVTRMSLGVQSFDDPTLEQLGRIHDAKEAIDSFSLLRDEGFNNISVDLLFGLPTASVKLAETNVRAIEELKPEHVSWYSLEFEQGTAMTTLRDKGFLSEPPEEMVNTEYEIIRTGLQAQGFEQYELFSFTQPGFSCRHNRGYWQGENYFGCGPSAHSHLNARRWSSPRDLKTYIHDWKAGRPAIENDETLRPERRLREALMTGLRECEGVDLAQMVHRYGVSLPEDVDRTFTVWANQGWLLREANRIRLHPTAYLTSDSLFRELV